MQPRWLRPVERITTAYSTITFAISDPDGSITNTLLDNRAALFGKEVTVSKWIDKPILIQCSLCHALGHNKASRACPLGKDSVKCYKCGGTHKSENHDHHCPRKHTVAGICDCTHFKCLNCHKTGHNCQDSRCPARDLFRPRTTCRPARTRNRDNEWVPAAEMEQPMEPTTEQPTAPDAHKLLYLTPPPPSTAPALYDDPFSPPPPPSTGGLTQTMDWEHDVPDRSQGWGWGEDAYTRRDQDSGWDREMDSGIFPPRSYSPSCPQSGADQKTLA